MNRSIKFIGGLAITLSLFSCVNEQKETVSPFKDVLNFNSEIGYLDGSLTKKLEMDDKIESTQISAPNWEVELKPFLDANFNKPANKGKYARTEVKSDLSGFRDVRWVAKEDNLLVTEAIYRYNATECVSAMIRIEKTSAAYDHFETLSYVKNSGYSIENEQVLSHVTNENFNLMAEFDGKPQPWRMFFEIGDNQVIPVNFDLKPTKDGYSLLFHQGKEVIEMAASKESGVYHVEVPVFQSFLTFVITGKGMTGKFHNLDKGDDYIIPFTALKLPYAAIVGDYSSQESANFDGKWETHFDTADEAYAAIGLFDRLGDDLIGTFATETGDYRFLQGKVVGDSFSLSTFDGSHLFLFTGQINGDKITNGKFYSGIHYQTTWSAKKNDSFKLINPDEMTSLREGVEKIDFSFPNMEGNMISLSNEKYKDKVVVLQILGSWCPNCMDETRYFNELNAKYNARGLEIIGLAFERSTDFNKAKESLQKATKDLGVSYPMLIAGTPKNSQKALPMITGIKSYPTSIILDKNGKVVKIHTGFYGPSTGTYYDNYTREMEALMDELLD
tara:strand:+ start:152834 stop:154510 length:1677 start_codon:yes stop_codon:yes gene_type:complete